jgi:hypothetical protein
MSGGGCIIGEAGSMIGEDGGGELASGTSTLSAVDTDFFFFFGFFFFFFLAAVCGASSSSTSSMVTVRPMPAVNHSSGYLGWDRPCLAYPWIDWGKQG